MDYESLGPNPKGLTYNLQIWSAARGAGSREAMKRSIMQLPVHNRCTLNTGI